MKYVALLRGINVGGNHKVPMTELRHVFEVLGLTDIATYSNSGNIIFNSEITPDASVIAKALASHFDFDINVLVLSAAQITTVAKVIPEEWLNNTEQKSDVLFLFGDVDTPDIIDQIRYRPEFETILYVPGTLIANISRKNQPKSSLVKLIGTPLYRRMTIRNVTTVRKLAELVHSS